MGRLEGKVAAVTGASGSKRHNGRCDLPNAVYIERSAARAARDLSEGKAATCQ